MSKKILIDASVDEEIRVAVTENGKLDDFEIEQNKKNAVKGDVYLAKITRVEPSLQAAFVDYGSNRHGFLPLTEIHPDYFKIPVSDQENLKKLSSNLQVDEEIEEIDLNGDKENGQIYKSENNSKKNYFNFFRKYKIQDVIKPRQVILVQINKEERGLKGAALTTFLSFAGR
jgi:ribonuclease E